MINEIRQTVLSILNKSNRGYIGPSDFNNFAREAQLQIFDELFQDFNKQINLENARRSGTDIADIAKGIAETIDVFSVTNFLSPSAANVFNLPSLSTTGDEWYRINKIVCYPTELANGTNTSVVANQLVSSSGTFTSLRIAANDIVVNVTDQTIARVVSVVSATVISLSADIFTGTGKTYQILDSSAPREAERVSHGKITMLNTSLLTPPSNTFPAYVQSADTIALFPTTLNDKGKVEAQYYKYPSSPKWTYVTLSAGEPLFDASASDYQDFQIPQEYSDRLIVKILAMSGLSIREQDIVNYSLIEQSKEIQK